MAKFSVSFPGLNADLDAEIERGELLSVDDLLEVMRPAAMRLAEYYKEVIERRFKRRTGSLADSMNFEDNYYLSGYAWFRVGPFGTHKTGQYERHSRAGDPLSRYAKHYRHPEKKAIKNAELAYLLEYGTPRIDATHWMEEANEEIYDEITDMIDQNFSALLKSKGL